MNHKLWCKGQRCWNFNIFEFFELKHLRAKKFEFICFIQENCLRHECWPQKYPCIVPIRVWLTVNEWLMSDLCYLIFTSYFGQPIIKRCLGPVRHRLCLSPNPCTALMRKIVKMPIADWLSYPPQLYINIGFGLKSTISILWIESWYYHFDRANKTYWYQWIVSI